MNQPRRHPARTNGRRVLATALLALAVRASVGFGATDPDTHHRELRFIWREANTRMASASKADDFAAAADRYAELVRRGVRNGPLFRNLGTALLLAEQYQPAVRALERAERYGGSDPDLRRNLLLALSGAAGGDTTVALPWYRYPLFWHYGLSGRVRMNIAVLAFGAIWLLLALRLGGFRRLVRDAVAVCIVLVILFGSSAATSLWQEHAEPGTYLLDRAQETGGRQP